MKRKLLGYMLKGMLYSCAVFGWWGLIYPQLTMTPDTVAVVYEESRQNMGGNSVQSSENVLEWDFDSDIYWKILQSEPEQIKLKSGLLRFLQKD